MDNRKVTSQEVAESWIARIEEAARTGNPLDLLQFWERAEQVPGLPPGWCPQTLISGRDLRQGLLAADSHSDPVGVEIRGAHIVGDVDLRFVDLKHPLIFTACTFHGSINMALSKLHSLRFQVVTFKSLDLQDVRISGDLHFRVVHSSKGVSGVGLQVDGTVELEATVLQNYQGEALKLDRARIQGDFLAPGLVAKGAVDMIGSRIEGHLSLSSAKISAPLDDALILDRIRVAGGFSANKARVVGCVRAPAARIEGNFAMMDARIDNKYALALFLDSAHMTGGLYVDFIEIQGKLSAVHARIDGKLSMYGARINNGDEPAVTLQSLTATDGINADEIEVSGAMSLSGGEVGGEVSLVSAKISSLGSYCLQLDGICISGSFFVNKIETSGTVRALGVDISGQLSLVDAKMLAREGAALDLSASRVTLGVYARGLVAQGEVLAVGAKFGAEVDFSSAGIFNLEGRALSLDTAEIAGSLSMTGLTALGKINAHAVTVGQQVDLRGAAIHGSMGVKVTFAHSKINVLILRNVQIFQGHVDLSRTKISELWTDPTGPPNIMADFSGWEVGDISGYIRSNYRALSIWLKDSAEAVRKPTDPAFLMQPWRAVADVYDKNGDHSGSRYLRYQAAKRSAHKERLLDSLSSWIYGALVGFGYKPARSAVWLVLVGIVTGIMIINNKENYVPVDPSVARAAAIDHATRNNESPPPEIDGSTPCELIPAYPCLKSGIYALNNVIPAAAATPRPDWVISSQAPWYLPIVMAVLRVGSWILLAMLLAGVTGLLRKI